ncbi:MAG: hypothetical protein C0408_00040 [Odoribacter sp.]|nr:hypothetical protein [Odoribacter sp.]
MLKLQMSLILVTYVIYFIFTFVMLIFSIMNERIREFLLAENKSSAQMAEEIGVQPSGISHILSGRNNPSLDFVMKMLKKYPALSTDWLLFGKGGMYREPQLHGLFDTEANNDTLGVTGKPVNRIDVNFSPPNTQNISEPDIIKDQKKGSGAGKTKRIVCIFEDDTFKEYFPGDE